jgi:allantoinase
MTSIDLLIRGGLLVTKDGVVETDLAIAGGKIAALGNEASGPAKRTLDATGLHILPGVIDSHVHFNEPGRTEWEGFQTGTQALAAGGGTLFFDMPLNAHPPTVDAASFQLKLAAAQQSSLTDFAFWGGLVPGNVDRLEELADCGVIGFKAFMSNSGIEDFSCVDDHVLRAGMKRAAELGLPVAVHAESDALTRDLAAECAANHRHSIRDYLDARPVRAELDAIARAVAIAGETGCALHIVHVSSGAGVDLVTEARSHGVDVTCETCPHYLTLVDTDVEELGAVAKCAPPPRGPNERETLWDRVKAGAIATIGSDHSPAPPAMKQDKDFFKVWGGISGVQHLLPLIINEGHHRRNLALPALAGLVSRNVAARFKLPQPKGRLEPGADADLAFVALNEHFEIRREDLLYRHAQSPYVGRRLRGKIVRTLLRGETLWENGKIVANPAGRLVKPIR